MAEGPMGGAQLQRLSQVFVINQLQGTREKQMKKRLYRNLEKERLKRPVGTKRETGKPGSEYRIESVTSQKSTSERASVSVRVRTHDAKQTTTSRTWLGQGRLGLKDLVGIHVLGFPTVIPMGIYSSAQGIMEDASSSCVVCMRHVGTGVRTLPQPKADSNAFWSERVFPSVPGPVCYANEGESVLGRPDTRLRSAASGSTSSCVKEASVVLGFLMLPCWSQFPQALTAGKVFEDSQLGKEPRPLGTNTAIGRAAPASAPLIAAGLQVRRRVTI
ncbi:hypothetical protein NDU88_003395 [Pleurodeles waltl]|uniref:Uncharacterized protein n=1 Tax=Pleurodeles waltl TaxID=8319 RepID=A0AAV7T620_PLEWA|nr:hypothetical protein NDU88_003395 [Pleurodeles waltl]